MCLTYALCACVSVHVCVSEGEKEREMGGCSICNKGINSKTYMNDANSVTTLPMMLPPAERAGMEKQF